jgi:hypothetical protein
MTRFPALPGRALFSPDPVPATPSPGPGGLVGPFLRNPGGFLREVGRHAGRLAVSHGPLLLAAAVLAAAAFAGARYGLWRWRNARLSPGARLVTIVPPPTVEPGSAEAL